MKKYVYMFSEGNANMKELLGGKGANLSEMMNLGLPIPNGFTVTTEVCTKYYNDGEKISEEIEQEILNSLKKLEVLTSKKMGDVNNPLLVSIRSGARASMPGMMDTILNLGLNDDVVEHLKASNGRFAYDSYRRFIQMFSDVVMEVDRALYEKELDEIKKERGIKLDTELTEDDLSTLVQKFKKIYKKEVKSDFPQDPKIQLMEAIKAVFRSWNNPRAITYRKLNEIPSDWGTAVNVQEMVFGNMGETSGTGVAFTRNPSNGENKIYGEYLMNAQGEDVVAGIRTPQAIETLKKINSEAYESFVTYANKLERYFKDMQDLEFTIEKGKLYILQTRNGKRTAEAALKIAVDLVEEKLITEKEALLRLDAKQLDQLLHPNFDQESLKKAKIIATGLPASPGAATGKIVFTAEKAVELKKEGVEGLVLVRTETSPEDIEGMHSCNGVLTVRGGMTSHAAVVARGMGTCCVAGCGEIIVNDEEKYFTDSEGNKYVEGDNISLDGATGNVYGEKIKTVGASVSGNFATIMEWADKYRQLEIRANADTPSDAKQAYNFGAEGIGLCRTEHMFFVSQRIFIMREMILAKTTEQREKALDKLLPMQRYDFEGLFREMKGYPVTIRLLDPPLHEFLPTEEDEIKKLAKDMKTTIKEMQETITELQEFNPMMGHRGCRLSVSYPEITKMQTRAIIEAAIIVQNEGIKVAPEIMIPLIGDVKELKYVKGLIVEEAQKVFNEKKTNLKYTIGTMIEVPRAALLAGEIAKEVEFFSFGTNDLTQMTFGFSRDDAGKFLNDYYDKKIYDYDPFQRIDEPGVGKLLQMAAWCGRETNPKLELGICGEHGGNPATIEFCQKSGLNYVSCSPFRVPIARLAAAQAVLKDSK